ncbi:MAG: hypothetical protein IJE59_05460 [Clostridia bacterium]|nr:hypothetical protein [Clostridia bacterium]
MKKLILKRKEVEKMIFKSKIYTMKELINKKIQNDIYSARKERAKGNMGTPIEEVLFNMRKILEGEGL